MWPTLRIVVGPSANNAVTASVCPVSLVAFMSTCAPGGGPPNQKAAEELTRNVAADGGDAAQQAIGVDDHGRTAVVEFAMGACAQLPQGVDEIGDRPGAHSLRSIEAKGAVAERHG